MENMVHCLIDRSGSMSNLKPNLIQSYNKYLDSLTDIHVALTMFDSAKVETFHEFLPVVDALRLNNENYQPGASTPLYDAMAHVMRLTEHAEQEAAKTARQQPQVLIVVYTDGQENTSTEYNKDKLNEYIKKMETERGWTFMYLGASPEAWKNEGIFAGTVSGQNIYQSAGGQGTNSTYSAASVSTANWASRKGSNRRLSSAHMAPAVLKEKVKKDSN